jgi:2-polyprenyl-3-methyl-5-hydroxy-6-metoxy-1,4-benzoquinol methylase
MREEKDIYDKHFYDRAYHLEASSAEAVVKILMERFHPRSVIDIGCGTGLYLKMFAQQGVEALGYEASPAAIAGSVVGERIRFHDLCQPLHVGESFGLCLCIEVAEHLPLSAAGVLVESLCRLSETLVFTAATPGQGDAGIGHINEQPHAFWIRKFAEFGFVLDRETTDDLRRLMREQEVVWWIPKNLMIFKKKIC